MKTFKDIRQPLEEKMSPEKIDRLEDFLSEVSNIEYEELYQVYSQYYDEDESIDTMVDDWNKMARKGKLLGKLPNEVLKRLKGISLRKVKKNPYVIEFNTKDVPGEWLTPNNIDEQKPLFFLSSSSKLKAVKDADQLNDVIFVQPDESITKNDLKENMTTAAAGIPQDTANMEPKKKRKTQPLTRHYVEVLGKRKRQIKY